LDIGGHYNTPVYESLKENIECDVLIVGGGSSGAQCAHYLSEAGLDVVIVDKRKVGQGSTYCNTALIQYLGEKTFTQLSNSFGEENAAHHLKLCEEGMNEIEKVCYSLDIQPDFQRRDSLYYASYQEDVEKLEKEYSLLKKHGFQVEFFTEEEISKHYPFSKHAAIYFRNDAELNPYKFTIGLLEKVKSKGVRIYEETEVKGRGIEKDGVVMFTTNGYSIKAQHVIVAAGYECLDFKKDKNAVIVSSYAVVTTPIDDFSSWYKRSLIWETARPYIYMRTTADNRVIIGGLDENTKYPQQRDSMLTSKKDKIIDEFNKLFPDISVEPEFYLSAFYGGTHDGLPMIGIYKELPHFYLLMGYGDNGTVYNMVLAKILRDVITKGTHPDLKLYLQTRPIIN
ncbi:NAD(P)/FAD-dependent oxidoreductase, partial [Alkaliphilus serpentinus]|uniref:NAD(P)/FAD-dependent oxidoreductase n=1 Tax=Alkaliphilus serpentinus TaxID=1482731 RepID=UPI001A9B3382